MGVTCLAPAIRLAKKFVEVVIVSTFISTMVKGTRNSKLVGTRQERGSRETRSIFFETLARRMDGYYLFESLFLYIFSFRMYSTFNVGHTTLPACVLRIDTMYISILLFWLSSCEKRRILVRTMLVEVTRIRCNKLVINLLRWSAPPRRPPLSPEPTLFEMAEAEVCSH